MALSTIIPAHPGYQVKYPDNAATWPVIAWKIHSSGTAGGTAYVIPITPNNSVDRPGFIILFEGTQL